MGSYCFILNEKEEVIHTADRAHVFENIWGLNFNAKTKREKAIASLEYNKCWIEDVLNFLKTRKDEKVMFVDEYFHDEFKYEGAKNGY